MTGRFNGLSDTQWKLLEPLLPHCPPKRPKGKPHTPGEKFITVCFGY